MMSCLASCLSSPSLHGCARPVSPPASRLSWHFQSLFAEDGFKRNISGQARHCRHWVFALRLALFCPESLFFPYPHQYLNFMHEHNPSDQLMEMNFNFTVFGAEEKYFYWHWLKDLNEQPAGLQHCTCSTQEGSARHKTSAFQACVPIVEPCFSDSFNKQKGENCLCI